MFAKPFTTAQVQSELEALLTDLHELEADLESKALAPEGFRV